MALITKILETTLAAGATSVTFNDADIPNSLIRVFATNSNIYPLNISLSGNILTVTYEAQASSMGVALELVKQGLEVIDGVSSTAADKALSANQGKLLNDSITTVSGNLSDLSTTVAGLVIPDEITDLSDVNVASIQDGQVLAWDDDTSKFVNVTPASGGGGVDYSTTEQDTGLKYTDGKTIYQKTLHLNAVTTGTLYTHDISNVDRIWIYDLSAARNTGWYTSGHVFQDATNHITESFSVIPSPTYLYTYLYGCTISNCDITVRYTKTS